MPVKYTIRGNPSFHLSKTVTVLPSAYNENEIYVDQQVHFHC